MSQQPNLLLYAFIYVPVSIQAYKFVTLFCISALFTLPTYLHTYDISNAGSLEAFDQAVKTYKQTRGSVANPDPQFTRNRHQHRNAYAIFCYTGLEMQYILVYK